MTRPCLDVGFPATSLIADMDEQRIDLIRRGAHAESDR